MRVPNWDVELAIWASAQVGRAFVWGETDCGTLIRKSQEIIHGENLWPEISYDSKVGALRVLTEVGSIRDQLLAKGATEHRLPYAQSGDIVALDETCHLIVVADKLLVAEEESDLSTVPLLTVSPDVVVYRLG